MAGRHLENLVLTITVEGGPLYGITTFFARPIKDLFSTLMQARVDLPCVRWGGKRQASRSGALTVEGRHGL